MAEATRGMNPALLGCESGVEFFADLASRKSRRGTHECVRDSRVRARLSFGMGFRTAFVLYVAVVVAGITFSFALKQSVKRRVVRVITVVLGMPLAFLASLGLFLRFTIFKEPPTVVELASRLATRRPDLEVLVAMSNEDSNFNRIAPGWVSTFGLDTGASLHETRWAEYRRIYHRGGIKLGIARYAETGDVFVIMDSVGLLNRGHASGYLYCSPTAPPDSARHKPCTANRDHDTHEYDPRTREEGYSFIKLDARWYAYDEGPS